MRAHLSVALLGLVLSVVLKAGCSRPGAIDLPDAALPPDSGAMLDGGGPGFSDSAIGTTELSLERLVPAHGPFTGGNRVILRGTGFTEDARVAIGGRAVQPEEHELLDSRRLAVVAPAGEVGPADVVVRRGDEEVTVDDGYAYDAIVVDPPRGSTSGGTFVTITGVGTSFGAGATVLFGRTPCAEVVVVSGTRITCRTPPSAPTSIDVSVQDGTAVTSAEDAFAYYDASDPVTGGLGGGPIRGTLDVTVLDAATRDPIEGAFAMLGEDLSTEQRGLTDARGQITFSTATLAGPQTLHVAKDCYQRTSVVAFDAATVTLFLRRVDPVTGPPRCRPPVDPGGGPGRSPAFVEGELIWRGPQEFAPNPWANVPEPEAGWERVAYVYATVREIGVPNPDPSSGGSRQRVLEVIPDDGLPHLGYPYRILVAPRGLAVFAVAGVQERSGSRRFVPHVMGIARSVLAGPGETVTGIDMVMDIPLSGAVEVTPGAVPTPPSSSPDRFRAQAFLEVPGEGFVRRRIAGQDFDTTRREDLSAGLRIAQQPPLTGLLADASYRVTAGWFSGASDSPPLTYAVIDGVRDVSTAVAMPEFLGIPDPVAPRAGESLPTDRVLRWTLNGGPTPDLFWLLVFGSDGNLAWEIFAPGDRTEVALPDLASVPGLYDLLPGTILWQLRAVRIVGFDYDELRYVELDERFWTHAAQNDAVVQR